MMAAEAFLGWLWGATLAGGGLTLVVFVLRWALGRQLPPAVLVVFWAMVVLRLLVPAVPEVRPSMLPSWTAPVVFPGGTVVPSLENQPLGALLMSPASGIPVQTEEAPAASGDSLLVGYGLFALWLFGFLVVLLGFLSGHLALRRRLRDLTPLDHPRVQTLADDCHRRMGQRVRVGLFTTSGMGTPAVYGLFLPKILLPRDLVDRLSDDDWRNILCHELAHVRRGDLFLQVWAGLALAIHWFNPLAWLTWLVLRTDTELACDRAVLNRMAAVDRPQYGHTLLNLASRRVSSLAWTPALVPWETPKREWKRRILMIATHRIEPWWKKGLSGFLVLFLGVVGMTQAQPVPTNGSTSGVTLTVTPSGKPRHALSLSPTGFLKAKLYELVVGGAQSFTLNGIPLKQNSVLADRDGVVLLDGEEVFPPWVLHTWGDGTAMVQAQELIRASSDDVADWAGLVFSTTLEGTAGPPQDASPQPSLPVYQPAELSFDVPDQPPSPKSASGSPWVAVKDSNTVAQAIVSTVAEAQALVPWSLAVPPTLPSGYQRAPDIAVFKDKWGHFFSSVGFRPTPATQGTLLLLMESDSSGWRPKKDGPWLQKTPVGTSEGRWGWTWSEFGSIDQKPVAVRATELSWSKDKRSFILIDSTGLTKQALVEIAATIP